MIGWIASESSGSHWAVLFDPGWSHPGIDVHSEGGPPGIEMQSGFGRCWEWCQRVVVLLSLEDTFCGRRLVIVCLESRAVRRCLRVEPEIVLGGG